MVLVALGAARTKAQKTRSIAALTQLRTQMESDYDGASYLNNVGKNGLSAVAVTSGTPSGYSEMSVTASTTGNYLSLYNDYKDNGGTTPTGTLAATAGYTAGFVLMFDASSYLIAGLPKGETKYYCIDSTGTIKPNSFTTWPTSTTCPAA
jgi:hypothetical protein